MDMDDRLLTELWEEYCEFLFPKSLYEFDLPVCYVTLDSAVAGCVSSLVSREGSLRPDQAEALLTSIASLSRELPPVDADGHSYLIRLREMANLALSVHGQRNDTAP